MAKIYSISIVEDTDYIRERLKSEINKEKSLICLSDFANGENAIMGISLNPPDLVIMDIGLPEISGIECMRILKKGNPDLGVLMFTVFDNDENIFNALKYGANGYIMKDARTAGVIKAIYEYIEGGAPMSPDIGKRVIQSFHKAKKVRNESIEFLTSHQENILHLISQGYLNKEIASKLGIKEGSVKVQISRIYKKLQVNNRVEAINKFNS